jgi:signal transduction histidine kinase
MSLKKKIALSFIISAFVIGALAAFEYVNFIEIKKEIRYLEITDTIRSKSLQLRRHEKNFFLYGPSPGESQAIHTYLAELNGIISENLSMDKSGELSQLKSSLSEYERRFNNIELQARGVSAGFQKLKASQRGFGRLFPLIESTFLEQPLKVEEFLKEVFPLSSDHKVLVGLRGLNSDMIILRKYGEDILIFSKEIDKVARENVERVIRISQIAILIFFPFFLMLGIGTLFVISNNVVKRLKEVIAVVERTGMGDFPKVPVPSRRDEVGVLIRKFNEMEEQLAQREVEIERKNRELLQSKKLAAIGTLASGVAHELNNPLNNIYISAQILEREAKDAPSPMIRETVNDIVGQTIRVKGIVGDLLEFARGREPLFAEVELNELIMGAYKLVSTATDTAKVTFAMETDPTGIRVDADHEQLERVFINLFTNAVAAMSGAGELKITVRRKGEGIEVRVSDSGKGIAADTLEKIFEPFYTTRDRGTGLGLAIVFNIIRKHGGEIKAESVEGKGTTFTIVLPVKKGAV